MPKACIARHSSGDGSRLRFSGEIGVVLNRQLLRFGVAERSLAARVTDRAIATETFREHASQHRNAVIDVVEDPHVSLPGTKAVKAASVLDQCSLPRHRQR